MTYRDEYDQTRAGLQNIVDAHPWYSAEAHAALTALIELSAYDDARRAALVSDTFAEWLAENPPSLVLARTISALQSEHDMKMQAPFNRGWCDVEYPD